MANEEIINYKSWQSECQKEGLFDKEYLYWLFIWKPY